VHGSAVIGIVTGLLLLVHGVCAAEPLWVVRSAGTEVPDGVAVSAGGKYVAVGGERIAVYSLEGEKVWGGFQAAKLVFSPQGEYLIAATDGGVRYLLPTGRTLWNDDERAPCSDIAVSLEGDYIGAATGKGVVLYNSAGEVVGSNTTIRAISVGISRDGTLVAMGTRDSISLANRSLHPLWEYHTYGAVSEILFSASPSLILASVDTELLVLHPSGNLLWLFRAGDSIGDISATADAKFIAVGSRDGKVYLLDTGGRRIWENDTGDWVTHVGISQNGSFIGAGGNARRILVYSGAGNTVMDYPVPGWVRGISLSPEGGYLAATVDDGNTYLFRTVPEVPAVPPSPATTVPETTAAVPEGTATVSSAATALLTPSPVPPTTPRAGSGSWVAVPVSLAVAAAAVRTGRRSEDLPG
jgi:WD40 repeat protein